MKSSKNNKKNIDGVQKSDVEEIKQNATANESKSISTFLFEYIGRKLQKIHSTNFRVSDVKKYAKSAKNKLGLQKSPKQKGYGKLITDEEKRYIF